MSQRTLTLGHSPDPDDAFMFYGLAKGLIPAHGFEFEHILQDIQTLNERATRGELDISAISIIKKFPGSSWLVIKFLPNLSTDSFNSCFSRSFIRTTTKWIDNDF